MTTFATLSEKYTGQTPIVLCQLELDHENAIRCNGVSTACYGTNGGVMNIDGDNDRTIRLSIRPVSFNSGIILQYGSMSTLQNFAFGTGASDNTYIVNLGLANVYSFKVNNTKDKWNNIILKYNKTTNELRVFFDNKLLLLDTVVINTGNDYQFRLGSGYSSTIASASIVTQSFFDGDIADVRNYSRNISGTERVSLSDGDKISSVGVEALYNFPAGTSGTSSATLGTDSSYHLRHLNVVNGTHCIGIDDGLRYFSSTEIEGDNFWEAYVTSFGSITRSMSLLSKAFQSSTLTITFSNVDNYFSENFAPEEITNRTATIRAGFEGQTIDEFQPVFKGIITEFTYSTKDFSVTIQDPTKKYTDSNDFVSTIEEDNFPNLGDGVAGRQFPIVYGDNQNASIEALEIDTTTNEWMVAGSAVKAIDNVWKIDGAGVKTLLSTPADYSINKAATYATGLGGYIATITLTAPLPNYKLICDCAGIEDVGDGTGQLITNPVRQIEHFMKNYLSIPDNLIDDVSIDTSATIAEVRGYVGQGSLTKRQTAQKTIEEMATSINAYVYHNNVGKISINIFEVSISSQFREFTDQDEIYAGTFKLTPDMKSISNKVIGNFDYYSKDKEFNNQYSKEDASEQNIIGKVYDTTLDLKWTRTDTHARDVVWRHLLRYKKPIVQVTFDTSLVGLNIELSDIIELTHYAGLGSGGYYKRYFQVQKLQVMLDRKIVKIAATDIYPWVTRWLYLGGNGTQPASWASTSLSENDKKYSYLCDGNTAEFSDGSEGKRL